MVPAIPFVGLAIAATVAYTIKKVANIVEAIVDRPDRAAEREHELKMAELKGKQALSGIAQEAFDTLQELRKLREGIELERAKLRSSAMAPSNPNVRTFKSN